MVIECSRDCTVGLKQARLSDSAVWCGGCEEALTNACSLLRVSTTFHWQAARQGLVTDKKSVTLLQSFLRVQDSKATVLLLLCLACVTISTRASIRAGGLLWCFCNFPRLLDARLLKLIAQSVKI